MITWQQLRDLKTQKYKDASDGWGELSSRARAAKDRVDHEMLAKLRDTQSAKAADEAIGALERLSRNYQYIHTEAGLIRTALNGFASELAGPQKKLNNALDEAQQLGFTVKPDGSVQYPAAVLSPTKTVTATPDVPLPFLPHKADADANPNQAKAEDIAKRIAAALRDAVEVDRRYQSVLAKLKTSRGVTVDDATWRDVSADTASVRGSSNGGIPKRKSPKDTLKWWNGLSRERQQELLTLYPDIIGQLDGVPAVARDEANRNYLPMLISKLNGQDDEKSRMQLEGLQKLASKLSEPSKPPMYLLGISDEGNGRAIVSYGNPDTARNVSAYVPGLGTALNEDFATIDLKRAKDTAIGAQKHDPSSASLVWLGYDAPNSQPRILLKTSMS
ncbi:alpha/beta hydrolase [Streptomyces sp. MST-110588]|uniref:alpha/beta hydrolase n=1 Tax=Streptomyces sp. MST-110588 TaxID=2833628 RepID=UPI0032420B1E